MTSIIKVDTIQTAAGGTPTASSLGIGGTGKIGQVVQSTSTTQTCTTSTSYTATSFSATITPSSTSSKIFGFLQCRPYTSVAGEELFLKITGGGTTQWEGATVFNGSGGANTAVNMTITFESSPNTTSAITYSVSIRSANGNNVCLQVNGSADGTGRMTLMEVLA